MERKVEPTLEQRRARHALDAIAEAKKRDVNYRTYVESLPATIVMNGLGHAMATLKSKDKPPHSLLYEHVASWLMSKDGPLGNGTLAMEIANADQETYLHAQVEALAYLTWLKKFAQAELPRSDRDRAAVEDER